MSALEIEYVELYTADQPAVLDYYVNSLGFTHLATSSGDKLISSFLRQGAVSVVVTSGPSTAEFLDQHGDGIADIALNCEDVSKVAVAARSTGARVETGPSGSPVVRDVAGIDHTLLPMSAVSRTEFPPGRNWQAATLQPGGPSGPIKQLDHVAICVEGYTLDDQADAYLTMFGLERYFSEYVAVGDQAMDSIVVRSASGGVTFTLVAPDPTKSPGQLDGFLYRNGGPGAQHLAFSVDHIVTAVHESESRGVQFLDVPPAYYDVLAQRLPALAGEIGDLRDASVLADRDEWGYLLQLFTRSPHPRNTLFYELIQREGSRGFGSANIRALYEAVERNRSAAGR